MSKDYYVGLDIGTSSVGFAVTDTEYNIVRKKGKDFWGVRLFDEAKTAAERRTARTSRRRLQRLKQRVGYLRKIFEPEIAKIDPGFIQRLNDSKFYEEDKQVKQPFALFADEKFTDKEYYEKYPTIFHLRKELIESKKPHDVRLVYLALLNMFKHRGHFLNESLSEEGSGSTSNLNDLFQELTEISGKVYTDVGNDSEGDDLSTTEGWIFDNIESAQKILQERKYTNSEKHEELLKIFDVDKKTEKNKVEALGLICGLKRKVNVIFDYSEDKFNDENKDIHSISFRDSNFEEKKEKLHQVLNDDEFSMILTLKDIHDSAELSQILSGAKYVSFAKVEQFEKHRKDLKLLKELFRKYHDKEEYNKFFRTMGHNTYSAYVGSLNYKNCKIKKWKDIKSDKFFDELKSTINELKEKNRKETRFDEIIRDIDSDNFLPKLLTTANGVIPYQCYLSEVKQILTNAEAYLDFLKVKDNSGLTAKERLIEIFKFRIPYYIGPLKKSEGSNAWVVRNDYSGTVYPWNFNEKIDEKSTSEKFMENLINHCTYLKDEYVLPKNSLLYEKFLVLNELNNLKINDQKISVDLKQKIYIELFRDKGKRVTNRALRAFLEREGVISKKDEDDCISGYDKASGGFISTLSNYHKFAEIFKSQELTDSQVEMAEEIIRCSTIYGDSKKFLREKIQELNKDNRLDKNQIERILGIRFKDWARLSKKFLNTQGADTKTGEVLTIIQRMWSENLNLQQILSSDFTYLDNINPVKTEKSLSEFSFEDLEDTYLSAPVKRMVWQTVKIMKEIVYIMGQEPKRIFIEMTRSEEVNNQRKDSRKKKLLDLYKKCREDNDKVLINKLDGTDDRELRIKKLYLYYMQKGKCMYSGKNIDFDKLMDDNYYDIDHIYPRHFVKDDSLEYNLVLVESKYNRDKTDTYPIDESIRNSQHNFWYYLKENGFITNEKYRRLIRNTGFSDDDLSSFINRQIVETGQGTKQVADILKQVFANDNVISQKVVYVKAGNISDFRQSKGMFKSRILNDFHHAKDAYLNIIVGNAYFTKFTLSPSNFISDYRKNSSKYQYHMYRMFDFKIERNGEVAWDPKKHDDIVKKIIYKNSPIITKKTEEVHGALFDLKPISSKITQKSPNSYLSLKSNTLNTNFNVEKYGGYNNVTGTYFFLVEHTVEKKKQKVRVRTIEDLPLYLKNKLKTKEDLVKYCRETLGYIDPDIRISKIPRNSLIKINGFASYITGRTNDRLTTPSAEQLYLTRDMEKYTKVVANSNDKKYSNDYLEKICKYSKDKNYSNYEHSMPYINNKTNIQLYTTLCTMHSRGKFSKKPSSIAEILVKGKQKFERLNLEEQSKVLYNILSLSFDNHGIDLSLIGGSSRSGSATINKNISNFEEALLICRSITGMFEYNIDLKTV
jgi:CRISPR-associated endonuclease Csn1